MMTALLVAGTLAVLAGLGAIALGIPVKEFSFGNTMILSGTIGVCTGLLLFGLSVVLGELKVISHRLRLRPGADAPAEGPAPKPLDLPAETGRTDLSGTPPLDDLWREPSPPRGRTRSSPLAPPPPLEPEPEFDPPSAPEPKPKRNLLFASASRRERERAEKRAAADPLAAEFRSPPLSEPFQVPHDEPRGTGATSFGDDWPKPERMRAPEPLAPPLPRRGARPAPAFAEPGPLPRGGEPQPSVTVVKSGVVDGMAYSLYSDGSIEAQMPEGMMRFGSIDELRSHLDQRG